MLLGEGRDAKLGSGGIRECDGSVSDCGGTTSRGATESRSVAEHRRLGGGGMKRRCRREGEGGRGSRTSVRHAEVRQNFGLVGVAAVLHAMGAMKERLQGSKAGLDFAVFDAEGISVISAFATFWDGRPVSEQGSPGGKGARDIAEKGLPDPEITEIVLETPISGDAVLCTSFANIGAAT
ncbi:hypothetical protein DFH09DRAFT_1092954 [Mycena vulgaris]|nr:hypothetical protein DFH09DRAFT_1092954 [Mycena vulgaris]